MKTNNFYNTKEEFEKKHPYVCVEAANYNGKKCAPAQIIDDFTSKKVAENNHQGGRIMTRKQAEKFIQKWNSEFEDGNYDVNF
jgi:hypothetical protein